MSGIRHRLQAVITVHTCFVILVQLDLYAALFIESLLLGHLSKHLQHTSINVQNGTHNLEVVDTKVDVHGSVTVWQGCQ